MRNLMSHDPQRNLLGFDYSKGLEDVDRVKAIWTQCLQKSKGPFLFGEFSIADAMYAPVGNRFISYDVKMDDLVAEFH